MQVKHVLLNVKLNWEKLKAKKDKNVEISKTSSNESLVTTAEIKT